MFRVLKSIALSGSLAVAALFATATDANAQGWGISFGGGYPNQAYQSQGFSNYGGYGGGYQTGYRGGYGNYQGYQNFNQGYNQFYGGGYQTFYTPGSQFRGNSPWNNRNGHHHHHHCD